MIIYILSIQVKNGTWISLPETLFTKVILSVLVSLPTTATWILRVHTFKFPPTREEVSQEKSQSCSVVTLKMTRVALWELLQLKLKRSSKPGVTAITPNDGRMLATVVVFHINTAETNRSPVRVKFQLSEPSTPLKSCVLSATLGAVLSVSVTTGGGSYQVILPQSEIAKITDP